MNCIFCKIIKGEIPCKKIYEDKFVIAFLDINPVTLGHTLVVPKEHFENIYNIPEEVLSNVTRVTKQLSTQYKEKLGNSGLNILQANGEIAGQTVFHYHMHIVPRYEDDGINLWFHRSVKKNIDLEEVLRKIKE